VPFESGGLADKLGNRYEGRWVVKQLLALLNEEICSITIEGIGDDEHGVDLWVGQKDGSREAFQCKARNASQEHWSIGDLRARGVLQKLKFQLDRDLNYKFIFVSSVGLRVFQDICDFARRSGNSVDNFYQYKINVASQEVKTCFQEFCSVLLLNPGKESDLNQVFNYLRRSEIRIYSDDSGTYRDLLERIDYLLIGGARESIYATLASYAENKDKWASPIYVDELRDYLINCGIQPKRLEHDSRIAPAIRNLQNQFVESIQPFLIKGSVIGRDETAVLIKSIEERKNIILCGAAGYGKSGVLFELVQYLRQKDLPFLPIQLDRKDPENTADQFGKKLGLPDSPAYTLAGFAQTRQAVLILDQLDALRWTSAHANNSLEVCKEMVRHIRSLQESGKEITVVLSCRTFDLEHDPSIKNWLVVEKGFVKIEVKELPDKKLKELIGAPFEQMTSKERSLLACPQNLSIWMELKRSGVTASFQNVTSLMQEFWRDRRSKIYKEAGIELSLLEQVLSILIDYMEKNGRISAPERVVSSWPNVIEALCSYGVLQKSSGVINFGHQRYLDYLIAMRLLDKIDSGSGDILGWLGTKESQTLFRREQLRQALLMISEDSQKFFHSVKEILESNNVRFHIKHLVLEILGLQEKVPEEVGLYCLGLFSDPFWQMHILETVFGGHGAFVGYLIKNGKISEWLEAKEDTKVGYALWLLRTVVNVMPDEVTQVLESYAESSGWSERILDTICWNVCDDSERMFQLRLKLIRSGVVRSFVDWKSLCAKYPLRAIQLIEALVSTWKVIDDSELSKRKRIEQWYDQDEAALRDVAMKLPLEVWDNFIPHIERLTNAKTDARSGSLAKWKKDRHERYGHTDIERGIVDLTIMAGKCLAGCDTESLINRLLVLENSDSLTVQEIVAEAYSVLPSGCADIGIKWLLKDKKAFRIDHSYHEFNWEPIISLIKSLSPFCSDALFKELEESINNYHAPNERDRARYYLHSWRQGYFGHYWGEAQYFLLPVLDSRRISPFTKDLIGVLKRKFDPKNFDRNRISGGFIGSKLDPSLEKISDRAWLKIVSNDKVKEEFSGKWIQVDSEHALESSIRQFSSSLQKIVRRYPERFGKLALFFPDNVHSAYISAILDGCNANSPDANMPEKEKLSWKPVSLDIIEALLTKFKMGEDRETVTSFCRLIMGRADESWSERTVERLIHYAKNHPDPEPGKLNVRRLDGDLEISVDDLFQNSINCVRGVAAEAIAELLWKHPDWMEKLRPAIESLVNDKHSAVRIAAIEILLPMINIDKNQAVKWFCVVCDGDQRVPASPRAREFINYTIQAHLKEIGPIITNMVSSSMVDVSKEGASEVTARWLFYGFFEHELKMCQSGTATQRRGVAVIASRFLYDDKYSEKCKNLLRPLLDDPDKEVRNELHGIFRDVSLLDDKIRPFIIEYIHSKAFLESSDRFIYYLENVEGSVLFLSDIILSLHEVFSSSFKKESREVTSHVPYTISEAFNLLLRLYDQATQANNSGITNRCLDVMDALYESRVGAVRNLSKVIEQG